MSRWRGSTGILASTFLILSASQTIAQAQSLTDSSQQEPPQAPAGPPNSPPSPSGAANREAAAAPSDSSAAAPTSEQSGATKSLFYFLVMSGKTQDQFQPLTQGGRAAAYAKGLFSPFHFLTAAGSAAISQWKDVPAAWGQGGEGFGLRFGNYFAKQTVQRTLRWWGEAALHEDNRYFGSGEHGVWRRTKYAVVSSVLARHDDGRQYFSFSQLGSTAGAAFISRLWQPSTNSSAGDGATSFGISMATNAGLNVLREFLPDMLRKAKLAK
ncbi:MAG TPA: hypothetical protein VLY24_19990 [Bryobacteraceae bacterium]|nr:hypothetical protein [Bryobacteraceae bacterium]